MCMNRLTTDERAQVIAHLIEGSSINSTVRLTGISKPTILKLIADLGAGCLRFHDMQVRNLATKRVECDEIWAFCYSKQANIPEEKVGQFGYGDVWTWTAIDSDSKLMIAWAVGDRTSSPANALLADVADRVSR